MWSGPLCDERWYWQHDDVGLAEQGCDLVVIDIAVDERDAVAVGAALDELARQRVTLPGLTDDRQGETARLIRRHRVEGANEGP